MLLVLSSAPKINWFSTQVLKDVEAVVFVPLDVLDAFELLVDALELLVDAFELLVDVVVDDDVY